MTESPTSTVFEPRDLAKARVAPPSRHAFPTPRLMVWTEWCHSRSWLPVVLIFLYSAFLALGTFALNGYYSLNFADEGFLRYGVHAIVTAGQVPLRDFQSYDPGRYYWVAGWSLVLGDGIVSTRLACSLFQVLGVGVALLSLRQAGVRWWMLGFIGLIVTCWMLERFKLYEQCIALMALYPAVRLIQRPDKTNALLAGVFVGLAAFMGRNHGLYNFIAFGALLALLAWKQRQMNLLKLVIPWAGGIVLGYLPMLLMMALVPGFFAAFIESLQTLAHSKATNLSLAVPWPWSYKVPENAPMYYFYWAKAVGWCFVLLPGGLAVAAVLLFRLPGRLWREHAGFVAAGVVGIPYAHFAFSRADAPHLAHAMPSLIITLLLMPPLLRQNRERWTTTIAIALGLGTITYFGTYPYNPIIGRIAAMNATRRPLTIGGQTLSLEPEMAAFIAGLQHFARTELAPNENILIAPFAPMLYEVVERPSPLQEIYFLWPQPAEKEREAIRTLERKHVNWTLLNVSELDHMAEHNLPYTHPLFMRYLHEHFRRVEDAPVSFPYILLRRANPLTAAAQP